MSTGNTQHLLDRNRKPRVHITYDTRVGDAIVERELPFVVGVFSDLSGHVDPNSPLPELAKRQFVEVRSETFDGVMADCKPRLSLRVENKVGPGGGALEVTLHFNKLDDFAPDRVARQVAELRDLIDERDRLARVMNEIESRPRFSRTLQEILDQGGDAPPAPGTEG